MATLHAAGYIVYDISAVFGTGATAADARAAYLSEMRRAGVTVLGDDADVPAEAVDYVLDSNFRVSPATAALIRAVEERGGDLPFDFIDGIACTPDEAVE